jgi:hypothetical protein
VSTSHGLLHISTSMLFRVAVFQKLPDAVDYFSHVLGNTISFTMIQLCNVVRVVLSLKSRQSDGSRRPVQSVGFRSEP